MKKCSGLMALLVTILLLIAVAVPALADKGVPAKGMVTLLDLGSDRCVPCRLMKPILEELKAEYDGRVAVIVHDVYQKRGLAREYGVRMIPTQIFFDATGKPVYRHEGFISKERIVNILVEMGVSKPN